MPPKPPTLDYSPPPTRSRLATAALILSLIALPTSLIFIGILPAMAALMLDHIAPPENIHQFNLAVILALISIVISFIALGWVLSLPHI